jgi:hypothetical protein
VAVFCCRVTSNLQNNTAWTYVCVCSQSPRFSAETCEANVMMTSVWVIKKEAYECDVWQFSVVGVA